ncbi:nucleotide disphospho-sugar-binding domain-containing protein [Streptomyces lancefieldiae]|uniref:Glycosyl transferase n=1 Tax=Streptomyces lancefieldiae TaxID=3075520 RepID=A0ABU3AKW2_9ACTN|nr:nucleotide disphospho-sugar-binding domain-containing protein [Streptomyces sp. DSM 40712]MDT0610819.1 glycosyl transferase [Streptomyces sp. DSM 40712]
MRLRVLLATPSSSDRLHTLMPWAWALRTAGHETQIAGRPDFVEAVTATGFVAVPVGPQAADGARLDLPEDVEGIADHASRWRPELVLWDGAAPAAAEAAARCGATSVAALGPYDHPAHPGAHVTYDCLPPSLRAPDRTAQDGERTGVRYVPYDGPGELPSWLGRKVRLPRVLVLGELTPQTVAGLFSSAAGLKIELLCRLRQDRIPAGVRLPSHTRLLDSVPVMATLPTCTAVVHDGSAALTMAAATLGLPQLVVGGGPHSTVPAVAHRLAAHGAALVAAPDGPVPGLPSLVEDPEPGERARLLAKEINGLPTPREAVARLVEPTAR